MEERPSLDGGCGSLENSMDQLRDMSQEIGKRFMAATTSAVKHRRRVTITTQNPGGALLGSKVVQ